jgi:hypothetical protein
MINILFQRPSPYEGKQRVFRNILLSKIEYSKLISVWEACAKHAKVL